MNVFPPTVDSLAAHATFSHLEDHAVLVGELPGLEWLFGACLFSVHSGCNHPLRNDVQPDPEQRSAGSFRLSVLR